MLFCYFDFQGICLPCNYWKSMHDSLRSGGCLAVRWETSSIKVKRETPLIEAHLGYDIKENVLFEMLSFEGHNSKERNSSVQDNFTIQIQLANYSEPFHLAAFLQLRFHNSINDK